MDRKARIQAKIAEQTERARKLQNLGPSCLFCIHGPERGAKGICHHPLFWRMEADAVTAEASLDSLTSTISARSERGLCGPEGTLYEQRNVISRVWRAVKFSPSLRQAR